MRYILFVTALAAVLFSCSKNKGSNGANEKALTTGSWKLSAYTTDYDKDGVYEENSFAILADCEKDNIFTFQVGGSATKDEGPTKCISSNPQTVTTTWSFMNNESKLKWGGITSDIEELTQSTLKLKATVAYNGIFTINIKTTYTKQ